MDQNRRRFAGAGLGLLIASLAAAVLSLSHDASAKVTFNSAYTREQTYNAALRLIRVDMGQKVTERDPDAAYILFEYTSHESGNQATPGSIEMIPKSDGVTVVIQLPRMPTYHEEVLADHLRRKMLSEYGDPPKRAPARPPSDADAGADGGKGDEKAE